MHCLWKATLLTCALALAAAAPAAAVQQTPDCVPVQPRLPPLTEEVQTSTGERIEIPLGSALRQDFKPEDITIKVRQPDGSDKIVHTPPYPVE